jgi:hypothetical protein
MASITYIPNYTKLLHKFNFFINILWNKWKPRKDGGLKHAFIKAEKNGNIFKHVALISLCMWECISFINQIHHLSGLA